VLLIAAAAALGAAYAAGYFDTTEDPGPLVVATASATNVPVDTPTPVDAPTIAPVVDEPTEVVVTPTEVFEAPTEESNPPVIESAVPDSSPGSGIDATGP